MNDKVERLITTQDREENITGMVLFPYNEEEIATWFHVNELDKLRFVDGMALYLTVPEFNQAMREADGCRRSRVRLMQLCVSLKRRNKMTQSKRQFPKWSGWGLRMRRYGSSVCRTVTVRRMNMSKFPFPAYYCK